MGSCSYSGPTRGILILDLFIVANFNDEPSCTHHTNMIRVVWSVKAMGLFCGYVFRNVSKEDEGWYQCEASNQEESIKSHPAYLLPAGMPVKSMIIKIIEYFISINTL